MSSPAHDIAEFLRAHELFGGLEPRHLESIAGRAAVETFPADAVILARGEPADSVRLVRRGAVELLDGGRALDRLGEGELFGHRAMLAGLPAGFEARAAEDTVCVRLSAADAVGLLARPMPLAATVDAGRLRIQQLSHEPAVLCDPDVAVSDAARRMVDEGASCVLVGSGGAPLGIVTERDMSARVLGAGRPADTRVAEVMTSPVVTIAP